MEVNLHIIQRLGPKGFALYLALRERGDVGNDMLKMLSGIGSSKSMREALNTLNELGYIKVTYSHMRRNIEVLEPDELGVLLKLSNKPGSEEKLNEREYIDVENLAMFNESVTAKLNSTNISIDTIDTTNTTNTNSTNSTIDEEDNSIPEESTPKTDADVIRASFSNERIDMQLPAPNQRNRTTLLLLYFSKKYLAKYGIEYIPAYKRDKKIFKDFIKRVKDNYDAALILIDYYFSHIDKFTNQRFPVANVAALGQPWIINLLVQGVLEEEEKEEQGVEDDSYEQQLLKQSSWKFQQGLSSNSN